VLTVSHTAMPACPAGHRGGPRLPDPTGACRWPCAALDRGPGQAKAEVSMANLKGIGMALYTYAAENQTSVPAPDLKT